LASLYGLRIPNGILTGDFCSRLTVDRWAVTEIKRENADSACLLWFRLEDIDVVEIVLTVKLEEVAAKVN